MKGVTLKTGKRVFKWSQRHKWQRVFRDVLADKINEVVIAEALRVNPESLADDNFAWLDSIITNVTKQHSKPVAELLAKRLSDHYDFIIAFHGTRSDSAADFLQHGIKVSDIKVQQLRAIERFGDSEALQSAVAELRQNGYEKNNHGKTYLSLTKEVFLGRSKGYLIDGSEYIATIANRIHRSHELSAIGKPLIIGCLIPAGILTPEFWRGRSFAMLEDYFKKLLRPAERQRIEPSYVIVTQHIPAESILNVFEFSETKRPHRQYNPYTGTINEWVETALHPFKIWPGCAQRV